MSNGTESTRYYFIPSLRRGLTTAIEQEFKEVEDTGAARASFSVKLNLKAEPKAIPQNEFPNKTVALYGPGDVLGFDSRIVVRTEPRHNVGDFEPNYFPFIEFAEPDFPWRYTPAKLDGENGSLIPWITVVVLIAEDVPDKNGISGKGKEVLGEGLFEDAEENRKIPWVKVKASSLPKSEEAWRWAHVQVVADDSLGTNGTSIGEELSARLPDILRNQPERAVSRLLCPRRLRPGVKYFAYVVPTFKLGVNVALGGSPKQGDTAVTFAWAENDAEIQLPYYYKWEFRTGLRGDYEHLVRLLEPRPLPGLGIADVDCSNPGYGLLNKLERPDLDPQHEAYHALGFESALKSVDTNFTPWGRDGNEADANEFREPLAKTLKQATEYLTPDGTGDDDPPVVGPPIYGHWHTDRATVGIEGGGEKGWLDELNLDPRHRAAAGFGAEVVKKQQEQLMASAWDQLGDIEKVNDILRRAQLGRELSAKVEKRLRSLALGDYVLFTTPLHGRLKAMDSDFSVRKQVRKSRIGKAPVDSALRRIARKRGSLRKRQMYQANADRPDDMLERFNDAKMKVVERSIPSRGMAEIGSVTQRLDAALAPNIIDQPNVGTVTADFEYTFAYGVGPLGTPPRIEVTGGGSWLVLTDNGNGTATLKGTPPAPQVPGNQWFGKAAKYPIQLKILEEGGTRAFEQRFTIVAVKKKTLQPGKLKKRRVLEEEETPSVKTISSRLVTRVAGVQPGSIWHTEVVAENRWFAAQSFEPDFVRQAVGHLSSNNPQYRIGQAIAQGLDGGWLATGKAESDTRPQFDDMEELRQGIKTRIDPHKTFVERTARRYHLRLAHPSERRRRKIPGRELDPIVVAPEFPQPMCEALEEISQDLLLRGIEKVPQNTVALLETNRRFIEAYMCGLNHEFSGELLWREYPGSLRGSSFRQFWQTGDFIPDASQIDCYRNAMGIEQWSQEDKHQFAELYRDQLGDTQGLSEADVFKNIVVMKAIEEACKDIPAMVAWRADRLGQNVNDLQEEEKLVLLIRGDLLKKYPNTVIYAVKGTGSGLPDLPEHTGNTGTILSPFFGGEAKPDITFLGFNLTAYEARTDNWFIVLEERCSELRFGLDIDEAGTDLAWGDFGLLDEFDAYINEIKPAGSDTEWNESAAAVASMTMQNPVRIAIDAKQLLPKEEALFELKEIETGDTFVIKLVKSDVIKHARDILRGIESEKTSVIGRIVKEQASYNPNWSYHLDPESVSFPKKTPSFCLASMDYVEQHLDEVGSINFLPINAWCPQGAALIKELVN